MSEAKVAPFTAQKPAAQSASPGRTTARKGVGRSILIFVLLAVVAVAGFFAWRYFTRPALPAGFAGGNGRLEATEIYVAAKYPGRVQEVLFDEGDTVEAGQVVARMDVEPLRAQLREAEAQIKAAQDRHRVSLTEISAKQAEYNFARRQYDRSVGLVGSGAVSQREADLDNSNMLTSRAELAGTQARAVEATSQIEATAATAERLRAEIRDSVLVAPMRGRVESRLAEPGEVVASGGRVYSIVDLSDVYMYVFLPERVTGKVALGSEARIVLDAAPQYPVRARVSYISPMAQFTPKSVETKEERHDLTFRVKLQIPRERLAEFEPLVKTGIPGMGYVRFDQQAEWPEDLRVKAVPANLWTPAGGVRK